MNILTTISIEGLERSPGSTLIKILDDIKQDVFKPDDRIVFSCYEPVKLETLNYIEWGCYYIDIPFFFVVCNTDQPNVANFFSSLDTEITITNNKEMHVEIYGDKNPLYYNGNLCTHPWVGIHVHPDGYTSLCCEDRDRIGDYNVKQDTIEDIFYSAEMNKIRQEFRNGKTPKRCSSCALAESQGKASKRNLVLTKHRNIVKNIDFETEGGLYFIGGHLGNLCNAKCRICNSKYSSSIAVEDIKHGTPEVKEIAKVNLKENVWNKNFDFWEKLKSYNTLCNFEFLGGETFLQEYNIKYMHWLIETGKSKDCMFEVVTNGSVLPKAISELSDKFYKFSITVSIDNLYERFELERKGVKWHDMEQNLDKLCSLPKVSVGVNVTVSLLNVYYLPEVLEWLHSKNISYYHLSILSTPSYLSIYTIPNDYRDEVIDRLKDIQELSFVVDILRDNNPDDATHFVDYMQQKDSIRKESFEYTHPEVARFYYK